MSCNLKKKLLPSVMATALISGVTFSGNAAAVEVAADATGQVLLAPIFYVKNEGQVNYIKVINTSFTHAVKARIAFRSRVNSTEVLDFILYLTPGDIWRGEVVNVAGQSWVKSTDDSVRNLPFADSFASVAGKAASVQMFDAALSVNDDNEMGHFEVIGAYSATGVVNTPSGFITIKQGMSKFDLAKIFDTPIATLLPLNACAVGAIVGCNLRTDDPTSVQLRGEVSLSLAGDQFGYEMTALDDSTDTGLVISNPFYDVAVRLSVDLGANFAGPGVDNILNIESALAAAGFGASYQNNDKGLSFSLITFPTKYRHFKQDPCASGSTANWTPPFSPQGTMGYNIRQLDNQEHDVISADISVSGSLTPPGAKILPEVEWFLPEWKFAEGWYSLNLIPEVGCPYPGAPAIVNTLNMNGSKSEFIPNSPL